MKEVKNMKNEMIETVETIKETIRKVNNVGLYLEALAYSVSLSEVNAGNDAGHEYRIKLLEIIDDVYNA